MHCFYWRKNRIWEGGVSKEKRVPKYKALFDRGNEVKVSNYWTL